MSDQRYCRQDTDRTEPIRNFGTAFRPSAGGEPWTAPPDWMGSGAAADTPDLSGPADSTGTDPSDFVTRGVRMGYDLLQEQMSRGHDFARNANSSFGERLPDLRQITESILSFYSQASIDAALFWFDLLRPDRKPQPPPPPPRPSSIPVAVLSTRPACGSVQLRPGFDPAALQACQLWSRDTTKPPLMDVAFLTQQGKVYLKVQIPDNQPPDLYLGVACDRTTGEPLGTIAVHVTQP